MTTFDSTKRYATPAIVLISADDVVARQDNKVVNIERGSLVDLRDYTYIEFDEFKLELKKITVDYSYMQNPDSEWCQALYFAFDWQSTSEWVETINLG